MESSALATLPTELFGMVTSFLDLHDLASLRLACRQISIAAASEERFVALFRRQTIHVDAKNLQRFVDITNDKSSFLIGQLCEYTLVDTVEDWKYENRVVSVSSGHRKQETVENRTRLLAQAFGNVKACLLQNGTQLLCLRLRVAIRKQDGTRTDPENTGVTGYPIAIWRLTWDVARRLFRVAMAALDASRLTVNEELDLFHGQVYCNLGCDLFVDSLDWFPWADVFRSLQCLKLNASSPARDHTEDKLTTRHQKAVWGAVYKLAGAEDNTSHDVRTLKGICGQRILQAILQLLYRLEPALQAIDLCWRQTELVRRTSRPYNLDAIVGRHNLAPQRPRRLPPPPVVPPLTVPRHGHRRPLQSCTLSGLECSEANLVRFIEITQPTHLSLARLHLRPGTFQPVFDCITDRDSAVRSFSLDSLDEQSGLVNFDVPGPPAFPYDDGGGSPMTLSRQGEDAKLPISYRFPTGRRKRTAAEFAWRQEFQRLYRVPYS